ncbi:MAG TPA: PAS domain-containing protein [Burkholderiaceae bacterium]|nr:PAS domain-containing protein [Burkholderiaceae bacterium]
MTIASKDLRSRADPAQAGSTGKVLAVVLIYAVCAAAWIIVSDLLIDLLVEDAGLRAHLSIFKGWLFVAVTAALLFVVLRAYARPSDAQAYEPVRAASLAWPMALVAAIVTAFTSAAIMGAYQHERADDSATLEAISDLRLAQITNWLAERRAQAQFVSTSILFADLYHRWHDSGDAPSAERLLQRLIDFRTADGAQSVLMVDEAGDVVLSEVQAQAENAPELRAAARRALASGTVQMTSIYGQDDAVPAPRIDIVVPLVRTGKPARAAVVMRIDPKVFLLPTLDAWPFPTTAGATVLAQRNGDKLVLFGRGRVLSPGSSADLLVSRYVRGEVLAGRTIEGVDARGVPVLGVVRPVPDTDWYLVAKIDRSEVIAGVLKDVLWITAGGLLALIAGWVGIYHLRQRQRFNLALLERAGQLRALQLVEERLRLFIEHAPVAIAMFDREMKYLAASRRWLADFGLGERSLVGLYHYDVFPESPLEWKEAHARCLAGAVEHSDADILTRADGALDWVRWEMRPWHTESGAVGGSLLFSEVITERKRMQAENERAAALVTATLDSTDNGILVADETGRIVMWNRRLLALIPDLPEPVLRTGSREAILEHLIHLFVDPEGVRRAGREIDKRPDYVDLATSELTDGRFMERFTRPIRVDGRVVGRVWSFRDVTARQRAIADAETRSRELEDKVRRRTEDLETAIAERTASDQLAHLIANNIPGRVSYWNRELRCVFVNKIYCEFFGRSKEELIGRSMPEIFGEQRFGTMRNQVYGVLQGEPQRFERAERSAAGQDVMTLIHYVPDRQAEGIQGFFVLTTDITEAKRTERHLQELNDELTRARDRADAANRAKSAFLANMSHEIRTPMNAIIGFTHLLQRDLRTPAQVERLAKVDEAAHHLLAIINDILDLSKIESGKFTLEETDFSLDAVLSRTCALVADRARDKGLELVVDPGRVPDMLRGDPTRVSQALLNLLSNAVKFTEKGMILLRAELVESEPESVLVRFVVRDTGIGIAPEKIGRLFDAFEQADASTTRRFGGTGLGLAITHRIAQAMGGTADVESQTGVGSTFSFTARLGRGAPLTPALARSPLAGCRALVADELAETRAAICSMLASLGLRALAVASGKEALEAVKTADAQDPFDVVLLAADLPERDGREVARQLAGLSLHKSPPCVLVVASESAHVNGATDSCGNLPILTKPVTASSLHDCLSQALLHVAREPEAEAPPSHTEDLLRSRYSGARVLLAEDNPVNQEVALSLLEAAGLSVDLAVDGAQAVEAATETAYDLILLDVQMPIMDGLEAARRIRKLPGRALTPILAMTASAFGEDRAECMAAGMNEHVAKPVDAQTMYAALLRWLPHNHAPRSPSGQAPKRAEAAPSLLERLAGIPGLDAPLGLRFCGGREETFLLVLQQFEALYGNGASTLLADLEADRRRELHRFAHSLSGASGAMGATQVQKLAAALEAALAARRLPAEIASIVEQLRSALAALIRSLRDRLRLASIAPASTPAHVAPIITPELDATLDELDGLLANADFGAGALYRKSAASIRQLLGGEAQTFEQCLRLYDYPQARDFLRAARARNTTSPAS